jgi:hypothetical protein
MIYAQHHISTENCTRSQGDIYIPAAEKMQLQNHQILITVLLVLSILSKHQRLWLDRERGCYIYEDNQRGKTLAY